MTTTPGARRLLTGLAVAAATVLLTATQASAATPGFYFLHPATPAAFQVLRTGNLVHGSVDDALFGLTTSGSGPARLPFPLRVYDRTYRTAVVSSNGVVELGVTPAGATADPADECLPSRDFGRAAVLPYWDDLLFVHGRTVAGAPEGVFLRTAGTAPHRTFLVSWQGQEKAPGTPAVLAQVLFREGSPTITFGYGLPGGGSATVGVQSERQLTTTQLNCNAGTTIVQPATSMTFVLHRDGP